MFQRIIDPAMAYPKSPFSPDQHYPELTAICSDTNPNNNVYAAVREVFRRMGWDAGNHGTPLWNPLGHVVDGKRNIVIKPNLVLHKVGELACTIDSLVVHASVLRPLVDYILLASRRAGQDVSITIADTPLQSADFHEVCETSGLSALVRYYRERGTPIHVYDLRFEHAVINDRFLITQRVPLPGDPEGAVIVDVAERSAHFVGGDTRPGFSIQDYDDGATRDNHSGRVHRYKFSKTILNADLVFNVAKMKCHAKAGVTLALKNIVGANVSKDYLPHFRAGGPECGGDECPRSSPYSRTVRGLRNWFNRNKGALAPLHSMLKTVAYAVEEKRRSLGYETGFGGAWHGNDTLWRTIIDINRVLFFADPQGRLHDTPQRTIVCLLDGVVGMQGDGPLKGTDVRAGVIACGDDPVEFDANVTYMMGFDPSKVPHVEYWRHAEAARVGNFPEQFDADLAGAKVPVFEEPGGWRGKLKR